MKNLHSISLLIIFACLLWSDLASASSWPSFKASHLLEPSKEPAYDSWDLTDWITWLKNREELHRQVNSGRGEPLSMKPLNTVIIAEEDHLVQAFSTSSTIPFTNNNEWSAEIFPIYVFIRAPGTHRVFQCPDSYIAAKLDDRNRPIHFAAAFNSRPLHGNANYKLTKDCEEVLD